MYPQKHQIIPSTLNLDRDFETVFQILEKNPELLYYPDVAKNNVLGAAARNLLQ